MPTCGSCSKEVTICPECGGKVCEPGCADRKDDGCTCGQAPEKDVEQV